MAGALWRVVQPRKVGEDESPYGEPEGARSGREPLDYPAGVVEQAVDGACPVCRTPLPVNRPAPPTQVQWNTQVPLKLGDFVWPMASYFPLVSSDLADELGERFGGFSPEPVEVAEHRVSRE